MARRGRRALQGAVEDEGRCFKTVEVGIAHVSKS
jgi:hypothetical protein